MKIIVPFYCWNCLMNDICIGHQDRKETNYKNGWYKGICSQYKPINQNYQFNPFIDPDIFLIGGCYLKRGRDRWK